MAALTSTGSGGCVGSARILDTMFPDVSKVINQGSIKLLNLFLCRLLRPGRIVTKNTCSKAILFRRRKFMQTKGLQPPDWLQSCNLFQKGCTNQPLDWTPSRIHPVAAWTSGQGLEALKPSQRSCRILSTEMDGGLASLVYMLGVDSNPRSQSWNQWYKWGFKAALSGYLGEACCKIGSWRTVGRYKMMDKHHSFAGYSLWHLRHAAYLVSLGWSFKTFTALLSWEGNHCQGFAE